MKREEDKFILYLTILRFLPFKITDNVRRIYADIDMISKKIIISAYYQREQTEIEQELLDDIVTNSNAHIPDFSIESKVLLINEFNHSYNNDFVIFAFYDENE